MAGPQSGQKFIGQNRAPRVQLEYDLETYNGTVKVDLPFVMAVMADLSGDGKKESLTDRKLEAIDNENFDQVMKRAKPSIAIRVPNTLTGEGELSVNLSFESMDDFSPAAVARKVDSLNQLLTARTQLHNLLTYMDGKEDVEKLLSQILDDPALLQAMAAAPKTTETTPPQAGA